MIRAYRRRARRGILQSPRQIIVRSKKERERGANSSTFSPADNARVTYSIVFASVTQAPAPQLPGFRMW
jgi:hypothetical protein